MAGAVIAGLVMLAGCGDDDPSGAGPDETNRAGTAAASVVDGLCLARRQAASDPESASDTFLDTAHGPLHDLARNLGERDRSAAAAVLEAKQQVEADFETADPDLAADLAELIVATTAGYEAMGERVDRCESG